MMQNRIFTARDKFVTEVAEQYKQQGYRVVVDPARSELPDFLVNYQPDAIAQGSHDQVVIEVQAPGKSRKAEYWSELARIVDQHPGWRFDLVLPEASIAETARSLDETQIQGRLQQAQQLARQGALSGAWLIAWSALEAAMRLTCEQNDVPLPDFRPATIIVKLYTDGVLDREEYDQLLTLLPLRNMVAHGYQETGVEFSTLDWLGALTARLLTIHANGSE